VVGSEEYNRVMDALYRLYVNQLVKGSVHFMKTKNMIKNVIKSEYIESEMKFLSNLSYKMSREFDVLKKSLESN
jgi:hypothetical protein